MAYLCVFLVAFGIHSFAYGSETKTEQISTQSFNWKEIENPETFEVRLNPESCKDDVENKEANTLAFVIYNEWIKAYKRYIENNRNKIRGKIQGCSCKSIITILEFMRKLESENLNDYLWKMYNVMCSFKFPEEKLKDFLSHFVTYTPTEIISFFTDGRTIANEFLNNNKIDYMNKANRWNLETVMNEIKQFKHDATYAAIGFVIATNTGDELYEMLIKPFGSYECEDSYKKFALISAVVDKEIRETIMKDAKSFPNFIKNTLEFFYKEGQCDDKDVPGEEVFEFIKNTFVTLKNNNNWDLETIYGVAKLACIKTGNYESLSKDKIMEELAKAVKENPENKCF